ncbi:hypothetical protein NEOLEDRAFT_1240611 [Neolentinus lepideus HHB14362 ss-1]|uniref:Pentatricopeptide repeat-containing protein n=1 Tax=Neolentinus lepideus HHB14362 ss-1 TaxID=1314782 RepID=A0A165TNP9_9AGAM|nr:hypothetical protein NEOLEDRAFT_1240611 [Neolentinus lepideus HHB14362 ss-1]
MWVLQKINGTAFHPRLTQARWLHPSSSRRSTITLPVSQTRDYAENSSETISTGPASMTRNVYTVHDLPLEDDLTPTDAWERYTELVEKEGPENIAPVVHQTVLRRCVPSAKVLRWRTSREFVARFAWSKPFAYEERMRTVVRNMDKAGHVPHMEEYHFILGQFAAAGHYVGSYQVLKDMINFGIEPTAKTFGLILQAIAYRLAQPGRENQRQRLIHGTRRILDEVLQVMFTRGILWVSVNFDLTMRVLRETMDLSGFERLLRVSYGIDLTNPDKLALEHAASQSATGTTILPFSTAALNTTIDTMGRLAPVSKLVSAFEVLTTPLHPSTSQSSYTLEDDDDDFGIPPESQTVGRPPYATPNTKTYNILMQHLFAAHHHTFLRHYLLQAMRVEYEIDRRIRGLISYGVPIEKLPNHHTAVNRAMILAVYKQAIGRRKRELMNFVLKVCNRVLRRKRVHFQYYQELWQGTLARREAGSLNASTNATGSVPFTMTRFSQLRAENLVSPKLASTVFNENLDTSPSSQFLATPPKYLDLRTHLKILGRDIRQIERLAQSVEAEIIRWAPTMRRKLAARVAQGKAIYVTSVKKHVVVSRETWKMIVGNRRRQRLFVESDIVQQEAKQDTQGQPNSAPAEGPSDANRS